MNVSSSREVLPVAYSGQWVSVTHESRKPNWRGHSERDSVPERSLKQAAWIILSWHSNFMVLRTQSAGEAKAPEWKLTSSDPCWRSWRWPLLPSDGIWWVSSSSSRVRSSSIDCIAFNISFVVKGCSRDCPLWVAQFCQFQLSQTSFYPFLDNKAFWSMFKKKNKKQKRKDNS